MNLALLRGDYTVAIIPAIRRKEYVAALEAAHKDVAAFVDFIADCLVSTQEDLLRLLKNSGGVKTPNGGVNKKASGGVNLQDKILQEIKNNGGLNAPSLASRLSLSLRTVQRYLKGLTVSKKKSSSAERPRMADIIRVEETKKDDNFAALVAGGARNGLTL